MATDFSVRFLINRSTATYQLELTDASSGLTNPKGNFKVTYPNGEIEENTDFSSPDISALLTTHNGVIKFDTQSKVLRGDYTIKYTMVADEGVTTEEKTFNFSWQEPDLELTDQTDRLVPSVVFADVVDYANTGYTEVITSRTIDADYPTTSDLSGSSKSTGTATLDMVDSGNYYEGVYTCTLDVTVDYDEDIETYLSVRLVNGITPSITVNRAPTYTEIVTDVSEFKSNIDTLYKTSNTVEWDQQNETYRQIQALFNHLISRTASSTLAGSEEEVAELLSLLNSTSSSFQSGPISAFQLVIPTSETVNGLTYSNSTQTIWQETGSNGVFASQTPSPDPCDVTGTYSSGDLPAGLSLDTNTGIVTVSNFSSIPSGTSNYNITLTGTSGFSGSAVAALSITKETLWTPLNLADAATDLLQFLDFSEDATVTIVDNRFSDVTDRSANSADGSQTTASLRPYVSDINGVRAGLFRGSSLISSLGTSIGTGQFQFFIFYEGVPGGGAEFYYSRTSSDYLLRTVQSGGEFNTRKGGTISTVTPITDEQIDSYGSPSLMHIDFGGGASGSSNSDMRIDGGESLEELDFVTGSASFDSSLTWSLGSREPNTANAVFGGKIGMNLFIDGSITSGEREQIEGWACHKYGTQDKLNSSHPYKTLPPFT